MKVARTAGAGEAEKAGEVAAAMETAVGEQGAEREVAEKEVVRTVACWAVPAEEEARALATRAEEVRLAAATAVATAAAVWVARAEEARVVAVRATAEAVREVVKAQVVPAVRGVEVETRQNLEVRGGGSEAGGWERVAAAAAAAADRAAEATAEEMATAEEATEAATGEGTAEAAEAREEVEGATVEAEAASTQFGPPDRSETPRRSICSSLRSNC